LPRAKSRLDEKNLETLLKGKIGGEKRYEYNL